MKLIMDTSDLYDYTRRLLSYIQEWVESGYSEEKAPSGFIPADIREMELMFGEGYEKKEIK